MEKVRKANADINEEHSSVRAFLAPRDGGIVKQSDPSQAILHDYELTRQNLLMELSNYEANEMIAEQGTDSLPPEQRQKMGAIPVILSLVLSY